MSEMNERFCSRFYAGHYYELRKLAKYFGGIDARCRGRLVDTAAAELRRVSEILGGGGDGKFILAVNNDLGDGAYRISSDERAVTITGGDESGVLYGTYRFLILAAGGFDTDDSGKPAYSLRMIDHWDNADGSIERGYSGNSLFFADNDIKYDKQRVADLAALYASAGINAVSVNNVNVHTVETRFITEEFLGKIAALADIFADYGIKLFLSVNFAAPAEVDGLGTADPLDERVRKWWSDTAAAIYDKVPTFGGFLVKADSEGRPGPFTYGRDHADGADMLARAVAPFGGIVIWRCFVYNCHVDWRDRSTDRAKAAYDNFAPLDGRFADNVYLQVKNGPMDFQIREPVSPLFGGMNDTNIAVEFQITQEYTGQQTDLCWLIPMWKECLDFNTYAQSGGNAVKERITGAAGVSNVGDGEFLTGHPLAAANLYGFGRLIFDPSQSAERIAEEWVRAALTTEPDAVNAITGMLLRSREIYENYISPLGVGWMVTPNTHYGVDVDGYEYSRWGTYHYADRDGIGVDRTAATGTGYVRQYAPKNELLFESIETCPDELLLFFHHVSYKHVLHSGKTVIQHIYDSHFNGADEAEKLLETWKTLRGRVADEIYDEAMRRFELQLQNAVRWRDVVNTYFYRKSGIPDEKGRKIYY